MYECRFVEDNNQLNLLLLVTLPFKIIYIEFIYRKAPTTDRSILSSLAFIYALKIPFSN